MERSETRQYPSLIQTYFDTHTVDGVFLQNEERLLYVVRSDDKMYQLLTQLQLQHVVGSSSGSGRGGDDEPTEDEDEDVDGDDDS
ncbi:hypothetical protein Tco_0219951, partial [Tanacetum coccineum]